MNFSEAKTLLTKPTTKKRDGLPFRKLANNTYLEWRGPDRIAVRLHETDIVVFTPAYAELHTGGWLTVTTKSRINGYAPLNVWSDKGTWYVYVEDEEARPEVWRIDAPYGSDEYKARRRELLKASREWAARHRVRFFEGIQIGYDGRVLNAMSPAEQKKRQLATDRMMKQISDFVKLAQKKFAEGMAVPSGGDCWYCAMKTKDGKTLGDMGDNDHLVSHMRDRYVVPSLLYNAVTEAGYRVPGYILGVSADGTRMGGRSGHADMVGRALRKYLVSRLITPDMGFDYPGGYAPTGAAPRYNWGG